MSSWYSAAGYGWSGSYGSWYGRRRGSWGGKSEVRSGVDWFCQKCGAGIWWSRTDCRHCASVTNDDAVAPQSSAQEKIAVLENTLAGMGDDEPILAGKRCSEKELEKLERKLNGPKKTAKHIEDKQNWINRESKRFEFESVKLAEWQESLRVRKETLRVACEEIKILWEDLLREGESMDKNKTHFVSAENTEGIRILENWLSGGDRLRRDQLGGHETVQWSKSPAEQRRENSKRRSRKNPGMMPEWETTPWVVWIVLCRREGANTDIASNIRVETACGRERIRVCRVR